ncbi:MAG: hypothetical protein NT062_35595 [Proteobacteria bacterium]|nr:hypothetical protein [Pseudomonadota bacterium]
MSTYAKDIDKPAHEIPFIVERKAPTAGTTATATAPPDDDEEPADDDVTEDFEMKFAKELVAGASTPNRNKLVASATKLVQRVRAEEEKKLVAALAVIGVDWTSGDGASGSANLDVALTTSPTASIKAGTTIDVTATVKNTGTAPAFRVLSRVHADDNTFEDTELPIGKVNPGETRTYTTKIEVRKDAIDRVDRLSLEVREQRGAIAKIVPTELKIEAAPRPVFAYTYQLVDDGNGDGLVQRGEKYRLIVDVRNIGTGTAEKATILLRNATGDGVVLGKSRFEDKLVPGGVKEIEFPLATDATLKTDEVIVEFMAYDELLDVQTSQKLKFKVQPSVVGALSTGAVTAKAPVAIRSGASDGTTLIGNVGKGAGFASLGQFGGYTKVKVAGGGKVGFIPTASLTPGGATTGAFALAWSSVPPIITVKGTGIQTSADTYKLQGNASAEQHVEDVYIYVSNRSSHIDSRKVFYRSNRGGKDGKSLDFAADLPRWAGSNMVTVVARSSTETRSVQTMYIYKDATRTASKP